MDVLTSREFQISYQRLSEPVIVKAKWRTLGTWYPDGSEHGIVPELEEEIRHLKQQLAAVDRASPATPPRVSKPATNVRADSTFHPVPKPKGK